MKRELRVGAFQRLAVAFAFPACIGIVNRVGIQHVFTDVHNSMVQHPFRKGRGADESLFRVEYSKKTIVADIQLMSNDLLLKLMDIGIKVIAALFSEKYDCHCGIICGEVRYWVLIAIIVIAVK